MKRIGALETEGRAAALADLDRRPTAVRALGPRPADVAIAVSASGRTPYLAFTVPLAIWVMRGFLVGIPEELEHAARTDGATRLGAMWRVTLPLAAPGLATTAVLCFLEGWREFMLALTFMNEETRKTLPVVIQPFVGRGDTDRGAIMAASVLYTMPVAIVFLLLRKRLMRGTTAGAVKG